MKHLRTLLLILAAMLMVPSLAMAQGKIYKPHPERSKSVSNFGKGKDNKGTRSKEKKTFTPRTQYKNLDLQAVRDGQAYYISQSEWKAMSDAERVRYDRKGVVVCENDTVIAPFVVNLYDSGEDMTWEEAMNIYGDNLPSLEQAEEMARQYEGINAAIIVYGGNKDPEWCYWTKDEQDSSTALIVSMIYGGVNPCNKTDHPRVRTVAPLP